MESTPNKKIDDVAIQRGIKLFVTVGFEDLKEAVPFCAEETRAMIQKLFELRKNENVILKSSPNAWKPERQRVKEEEISEEEAMIKTTCRRVRFLLNRVTESTLKKFTEEFISFNVSSNEKQLEQVSRIILEKGCDEPMYCSLYVKICAAQVNHELPLNNLRSPFRNTILTRTQTFFKDKRDIDEEKVAVIEKEEDPVKREAMMIEEKQKFRRRKFGVMAFIGHLYRNTLIDTNIVRACILKLFGSIQPKKVDDKEQPLKKEDIDEESVLRGLHFIATVGQMIDKVPGFLDQRMKELNTAKPLFTNKLRFKLMDLEELRKEKWIPRKSTESGPKNFQPRMGPIQMPPQQQFYGQSYQNQLNNYYQPMSNPAPSNDEVIEETLQKIRSTMNALDSTTQREMRNIIVRICDSFRHQ